MDRVEYSKILRSKVSKMEDDLKFLVLREDVQIIFSSTQRGVIPAFSAYKNRESYSGMMIYDKVVGLGSAFFISRLDPKFILTKVISKPALIYLQNEGFNIQFEKSVDYIENRDRDDICPIEKLAKESELFEQFIESLESFLSKE